MDNAQLKKILDQIPEETRIFSKYIVQLAESIDQVLRDRGWRKKDLARRAGMKESQLSRYLSGSANPNLKTIAKISMALERELLSFPEFAGEGEYSISNTVVTRNGLETDMGGNEKWFPPSTHKSIKTSSPTETSDESI